MPIIKVLRQHKLLLDTHVWLWVGMGDERISKRFRKALDRLSGLQDILVSAISTWEVGMLVEKNRIELAMDPLDWVEKMLRAPGIALAPISPRIAIQSTRLPENGHGDPADRLLLATAREQNAVLVTCDEKLLAYGKGRYVSVHDPSR